MATHDIRSVIQKNYENLLNINVGEILGDLIDGNIIDLDEAKEIGFGSDKETANNLVQRLRGKSSEQIRRFCSILQTSEVHFTQITGFKLGSYIAEEDNAYRYKLERQLTVEDCDAIHEVGYDDEQRLIPTEGNYGKCDHHIVISSSLLRLY
ncbi:hypothetical protein TrispH2_011567 [Trichoplax sp. H2]|nr:hypothetical protein TrispH2_011567 [Trichoplax sp. H2]|eukprot:RDD36425.1 hypothetical protein TrispH2_011567 [Trichoplax sp. H2]